MPPPWPSSSSSTATRQRRARIPDRLKRRSRRRRSEPQPPEVCGGAPMRRRLALAILGLAVGLALTGPDAFAQAVPSSRADIAYSFAPVVKKAAPAVVNIYSRRVVQSQGISPLFQDPFFQQFFGNDFGL